ncbi:MAG TPA: DoxX family protein [Micromonosporaceae bacterium]
MSKTDTTASTVTGETSAISQVFPYAILIARIVVGSIFLAHGWFKVDTLGMAGTSDYFAGIGIPLSDLAAYVVTALELVGGLAIILGALLPVFGILLALNMIGAFWFAHAPAGFWANEGGYEFVVSLAATTLMIGFSGGGAFAADKKLGLYR